jgi:hypothetical protein
MILFHSLSFHVSRSPQYSIPSSRLPSQRSHTIRCSVYRALSYEVPRKRTPLQVPQRGPYGERCLFTELSFTYTSRPPIKEPFLRVPLAPIEKDVTFPEPYFICLPQYPVNDPLLLVTQRGPYGERFPFPEPSFTYLRSPNKQILVIKQNFTFLPKSPVKDLPPPWSLNRVAMESVPFPKAVVCSFIHSFYLSVSPVKELSHETGGKHIVPVNGVPRGRKAFIQRGAPWILKGIVYDTAITTPEQSGFISRPVYVGTVVEEKAHQYVFYRHFCVPLT